MPKLLNTSISVYTSASQLSGHWDFRRQSTQITGSNFVLHLPFVYTSVSSQCYLAPNTFSKRLLERSEHPENAG